MKHRLIHLLLVFIFGTQFFGSLPNAAGVTPNCVTVTTRNYYARKIHNDFIVREIGVCLSATTKSISYELPPLTQPLVLEATDDEFLTVTVVELAQPDQLIFESTGQSVSVELPQSDYPVRYQMRVEVSTRSDGVILGILNGQVVGKILLLDSHSSRTDTLLVALGGLSTEWWFETSARPLNSEVDFALITVPEENGSFTTSASGWTVVPHTNAADPLIIKGDKWLDGGYFAIQTTFTK